MAASDDDVQREEEQRLRDEEEDDDLLDRLERKRGGDSTRMRCASPASAARAARALAQESTVPQ
jgi:hypothetical protein